MSDFSKKGLGPLYFPIGLLEIGTFEIDAEQVHGEQIRTPRVCPGEFQVLQITASNAGYYIRMIGPPACANCGQPIRAD